MTFFAYDSNDPELILSCCLDDINLDDVSSEVIFPLNSKWKDRSLLYSTVQAYAALTGWKPTLSHTYCIKCSCYNRPIRGGKDRNFSAGSLRKGCEWLINIKSTMYDSVPITSGKTARQFKHIPVVRDGVPVIISKGSFKHTGSCDPSRLQQVLQRSRSGAYVKSISDTAFFTICTMYKDNGNVSSNVIRQILKSQFPANKNVSKAHIH